MRRPTDGGSEGEGRWRFPAGGGAVRLRGGIRGGAERRGGSRGRGGARSRGRRRRRGVSRSAPGGAARIQSSPASRRRRAIRARWPSTAARSPGTGPHSSVRPAITSSMAPASGAALSRAISAPTAAAPDRRHGRGRAGSAAGAGASSTSPRAVERQHVLDRAPQRPERADQAVAVGAEQARLASLHVLPSLPVEGPPSRDDLLHLVARLDPHARSHLVALVRRGQPVERPAGQEALEWRRRRGIVAEGLEERGEELLGGIRARVAHARGALVLHERGDEVQQRGAGPRAEATRLGERRHVVEPRVVERLERGEALDGLPRLAEEPHLIGQRPTPGDARRRPRCRCAGRRRRGSAPSRGARPRATRTPPRPGRGGRAPRGGGATGPARIRPGRRGVPPSPAGRSPSSAAASAADARRIVRGDVGSRERRRHAPPRPAVHEPE